MPIQFAPTELLYHIFQYLPKSSLLNCATVCKTWQPTAIQLFYENIELSEKTKEIWLHIVHQTPVTKNIGIFVKKLTVSLAFSTTLTQGEFLEVLSYLPYVKAIDLNLSGYKLHYLSYLNKRNSSCVTYLEDINTGDLFTDYQMQQYFLCAYSFRNSLKNLTLRNPNTIYNIDGQSGSALSFLNKFNNLSHVSIISNSHVNGNDLTRFLDTFQSCPKLVSFLYQNNDLSPPEEEDIDSMKSDANLFQWKKRLSTRSIISKLQTSELLVPSLTKPYIKNILSYFPTHLNAFTVSMTHTDYSLWIQEHNELFGLYLGYVKNLKISISNYSQRRYSIGRIPKSQEVLSKHWLFIQSIIGGRKIFRQMRFTFAKSDTKPDIKIERDQRNLILSYNLDNAQDIGTCLEEFSPIYSSPVITPLHFANNNEQVMLNSVVVDVPSNDGDFANNIRSVEIIKSVLSNSYHSSSPQSILIKHFNSSGDNNGYWLQLGSATSFIKQHYSQYNDSDFGDPFSLKYAFLKNINLQTLSLKAICDMLPYIKILKLINCRLEQKEDVFTIDFCGIDHLNQLVLDLGFLDMDQQRQILIKVEMFNGQVVCYKVCAGNFQQQTIILYSVIANLEDTVDYGDYSSFILIKCKELDEIICICGREVNKLVTLKPGLFNNKSSPSATDHTHLLFTV